MHAERPKAITRKTQIHRCPQEIRSHRPHRKHEGKHSGESDGQVGERQNESDKMLKKKASKANEGSVP